MTDDMKLILEKLEEINGKVTIVVEKVEKLEERVAVIEERLERLEERVAVIEERLEKLEERVAVIEERLERMEERVAVIEEKVQRLERDAAELKLSLENETNRNIRIVAEGHHDLTRKLDDALKVENEKEILLIRVNVLENELRRVKERLEQAAS